MKISNPGILDGAVTTAKLADAAVTAAKLATAVNPVGVGQTWQDVTGSRAKNTEYQNTTGRPIAVCITMGSDSSGTAVDYYVSSASPPTGLVGKFNNVVGVGVYGAVTFIVPADHYYKTTAAGALISWSELR